MPTGKPKVELLLLLNDGKADVVATTIYGDDFSCKDISKFEPTAVVLSFNIMASGSNRVRFDEVLRIRDESQCDVKELYRKQDPLFDDIKETLGYKMHESEIWTIVNLARGKHANTGFR